MILRRTLTYSDEGSCNWEVIANFRHAYFNEVIAVKIISDNPKNNAMPTLTTHTIMVFFVSLIFSISLVSCSAKPIFRSALVAISFEFATSDKASFASSGLAPNFVNTLYRAISDILIPLLHQYLISCFSF